MNRVIERRTVQRARFRQVPAAGVKGGAAPRAAEGDSANLKSRWVAAMDATALATRPGEADEFDSLVKEWRATRGHSSSAAKLADNAAYRRIIAMGQAAVPLILGELRRRPDHWFLALSAITGANPVPPGVRTVQEMAHAWLAWGAAHGFLD